jgi:hypothetical protein
VASESIAGASFQTCVRIVTGFGQQHTIDNALNDLGDDHRFNFFFKYSAV